MLIESSFGSPKHWYPISLDSLTSHQRSLVKEHLVNLDNKSNGIFLSFSPLHPKLSPGSKIIDNFSDCFSFNLSNRKKNDKTHLQQLDNTVIESSSSPTTAIVVTDASIKNNIATSILHMYIANSSLTRTLHYVAFATSTEAKLFAIRCGINQASNKENVFKIIVITNAIHAAKKIFNPLSHPFQVHTVAILSDLCHFFTINQNNLIEF